MCGIGFQNPWWSAPMAFAPALLATILIFMDQQITSVIVNRKENKLMVRPIAYYLSSFTLFNRYIIYKGVKLYSLLLLFYVKRAPVTY